MKYVKNIGLSLIMVTSLTMPLIAAAQSSPFSRVIEANGVIYLAGHLGRDSETRSYGETMGQQTKATLENIGTTLESVNADFADIVRCQVFMTDISKFSEMNAAYRQFFPSNPPARTTVGVASLAAADALIEIECTAVRGHGQKTKSEDK
ncbi:RidA family protein [Hellea sp.]|nr:RidA family protein [Hellea sp.]